MARYLDLRKISSDDLRRYIAGVLANKFKPHLGQQLLNHAIVDKGIKRAFVRCGRKFGKSSDAIYLAHHRALNYPGQRIYILCPLLKQVKAIYWEEYRIHEFAAQVTYVSEKGETKTDSTGLVSHVDNQDYRIDFYNGSFIKIDGSDNYSAQRGYNPDAVFADEFADFDARWMPVIIPNLASRNGTIVFYGTPPEEPYLVDGTPHQYVALDSEFQRRMLNGSGYWLHAPSWANNEVFGKPEGKAWLEDEKRRLYENGEWYVWEREYCAKIVRGGAHSIFPQFSIEKHVTPHESLMAMIRTSPERFEYYCLVDPGTTSVFAGLFIAFDPYANTFYVLDEIYQTKMEDASVDAVMALVLPKAKAIHTNLRAWDRYSDSAAAWFINEVASRDREFEGFTFAPTLKRVGDKQEGISLMRDVFRHRTAFISDRCTNLHGELLNYATDKNGKIPKKNDHCIDLVRYFLAASGFVLNERKQEQIIKAPPTWKQPSSLPSANQSSTLEISLLPDYEYIFD